MANNECLDLVDIAVLLNYEYATTDERFRDTTLHEIAYPGQELRFLKFNPEILPQDWNDNKRTWIALHWANTRTDRPLPPTKGANVSSHFPLTDRQLETAFYQTRAVDSGAIFLLEIFFALFPRSTELYIRHAPRGNEPGRAYTTSINNRTIVQDTLTEPKFSTVVCLPLRPQMTTVGTRPETTHVYMEFRAPDDAATSVLDMASMQFGEVGRGPREKGKMLVVLETRADYDERLLRFAGGVDVEQRQTVFLDKGYRDMYHASLERAARKVKERWENRDTEKWCAHCGAPGPKFKCAGCGEAWFCGKEHQKMVWSFHKGYCNKG
ncbi:hypothetical protein OPT61_g5030 [Boeremia exigua]|uniref:Uncharacterized protein n=1 Tax=Boeremia exigua TaxID=749465 RepID=A0ACC2IC00_9PLEO|nr:hypothetical protein OPT61_g5030 [Boeremia exigua]